MVLRWFNCARSRCRRRSFTSRLKPRLRRRWQCGVQLIINDRVDVALAVGANGVHLGQDDMPPEAARKLLGAEPWSGYSTHNVEQAIEASELPIDYLAIGPIFATATKTDTAPVLGLEGLRAVRKLSVTSRWWQSAVSLTNARDVIEAGADSVAVISALLAHPDGITEATQTLLRSLHHPASNIIFLRLSSLCARI